MLIPSIDLMGGRTVQLIGGEELSVDAGAPEPLLQRFGLVGEVAVIDLDAARGEGSNADRISSLLKAGRLRVGGGIRDKTTALAWLDRGAEKVILGTAATPELLASLPRDRVIAAVDARDGRVVVEGWRQDGGHDLMDRVRELSPHVGGFLVTLVENEGRRTGIDLARVREIRDACGEARLCIAGGLATADEVAALDAMGVDAQVGMALYRGDFGLAAALWSCARPDDDGLLATVICDEAGVALGLAWSTKESLEMALDRRRGVYWSRSRQELWEKGKTSGATQSLLSVDLDCDRDALRFTVSQAGRGFCHQETRTCWGPDRGIGRLARRLSARARSAPAGSYTARLLADRSLLADKLVEEAQELAEADAPDSVCHEAADVLYFALTAAARAGVELDDIARELDRRERRVTRRRGDRKAKENEA